MVARLARTLAVVALTVAVVAFGAYVMTRSVDARRAAGQEAASYNATMTTPPPVDVTGRQPLVTVVGDNMSAVAQAAKPATEWPLLVSRELNAQIVSLSSAGSGYTAKPQSWTYGGTFVTRAPHVSSNSKVVVFFGGANDAGIKESRLRDSVAVSLQEAQKAAPDAKLIVVGPVHTSTELPPQLTQVRDVLKEVAAQKKVQFVDPIAGKWVDGVKGAFGEDGRTPTEAGQVAIADRMQPLLEGALR